jgi:hypothetical protein
MKKLVTGLLILLAAMAGFTWFTSHWSYSIGQRAGYVQVLARTGWPCKTWEGEMAMVGAPLSSRDRFYFTVPSDAVAATLNANTDKLVALHYDQHKGLLAPCIGRSPYFVTGVRVIR